jgi:hypothetical protein
MPARLLQWELASSLDIEILMNPTYSMHLQLGRSGFMEMWNGEESKLAARIQRMSEGGGRGLRPPGGME